MNTLNTIGQQFADALAAATTQNDIAAVARNSGQKVHVTGAGRTLTFAYEQLRNAAEYTEEHLLLQRAVQRFYRRVFLSRDIKLVGASGEDLIIELTLAGYLENDSVLTSTISEVNALATKYYAAHAQYAKEAWTLNVLAVEVERLLNMDLKRDVFTQFAYDYFLETIDQTKLFGKPVADFELSLFVAVHRALLKSDSATIRTALLHRYQQEPGTGAYSQTNEMIDRILDSSTTDMVFRLVGKRGAPLRILWRLIDEHENATTLLRSREQFLSAYESQIETEYSQINSRINKGIIKSVIFLIITKVLIGVSIEVPYDYMVHGAILWLPLAINLLFPPIYMILLRFTLRLPGSANTTALSDTVDNLLYGENRVASANYRAKRGFGLAFNVAYALFFILVFGGAALWLLTLGFSLLHLFIFFIFLSTASFLGFRLSRQIRELEVVEGQEDGITIVRDFLYIPFVVVGRWLSEKYSRINIVAMILDMVIELPLKTILHLIRQWGMFITSKKDEL
ncbi:MAG: hypothetical protein HZB75_01180 [Candidatus Saccharibacteria bacterium]|nr:MAG: hypothetical protein HZB75_01180 [Candidatus Saccharibacteria bacterium]